VREHVPAPVRRLARPLKPYLPRRLGGTGYPPRFESNWDEPLEAYLDLDWHEQVHYKRSQELVIEFLGRIAPPGRELELLDAPCGNGRLYRGLEQAGLLERIHYTGVDITPGLVEASRQLMPTVTIAQGSVEALPFADGAFDVIVSQHVIRHLESYESAIQEFLRVSRDLVVIAEKGAAEPGAPDIIDAYWSSRTESYYWANSWEPTRLKQFARAHGARHTFTLNDARADDPDGQFVYVFSKR
jgi:ubiquinone/menaquinone biosynthesis C-methylase UbiE